MCMSERLRPCRLTLIMLALVMLAVSGASRVYSAEPSTRILGLGTPLETAEAMPAIVWADGDGLPDGEGQADAGASLYAAQCASCHGTTGEGGSAPELVGDPESLTTDWPDRGIAPRWPVFAPLYDYLQRAMPPEAPGSLSDTETWHLLAHLLILNGLHDPKEILDRESLLAIRSPVADRVLDVEGQ